MRERMHAYPQPRSIEMFWSYYYLSVPGDDFRLNPLPRRLIPKWWTFDFDYVFFVGISADDPVMVDVLWNESILLYTDGKNHPFRSFSLDATLSNAFT